MGSLATLLRGSGPKPRRRRILQLEPLESRVLLNGAGLWLTQLAPTGGAATPFDTMELCFSEAVQDGSFTLDDVMLSGPGGSIAPGGLSKLAADRYELDCTGLTGLDAYSLSIGPDVVADATGEAMDQDRDGTPGEGGEDAYVASLFAKDIAIADGDATYDGQALVLYGDTATIDGTHPFASLEVLGGATLGHSATTTGEEFRLELTITDELWIDATSGIDVNARGYLAGYTLGNTTTGASTVRSAGSYGGEGESVGDVGVSGSTNATYGDFRDPNELGSGGAVIGKSGAGGGLVRITADLATVDGAIAADGARGIHDGWEGASGGSGGAIRLDVATLTGSGTISANGGDGWDYSRGGGGGRIAIYYDDMSGFDPARITTHTYHGGGAGTVFLQQGGGESVLEVDSGDGASLAGLTPLGGAGDTVVEVDELLVLGKGTVAVPAHGGLPIVAGTATVGPWAALSHRPATESETFELELVVHGHLIVEEYGRIDVTGCGYLPGYTLGNTTVGGAAGSSGGSYGGRGAWCAGSTNATYGNPLAPGELGSGGGAGGGADPWYGVGGGLIDIVAESATIDGTIVADGRAVWGISVNPPGGGSGGAILMDVGALDGDGSISASGGGGMGSPPSGGGGGGRIAIYSEDTSGFGVSSIAVSGGVGGGGLGGDGTVHVGTLRPLLWVSPTAPWLHGAQTLEWRAVALERVDASVDVTVRGEEFEATLGTGLPEAGTLPWDISSMADGWYRLELSARDGESQRVAEGDLDVLLLSSVAWHGGEIAVDETWPAGVVHLVESDVAIGSGATLTIEPGAVVKFVPGTGILAGDGGALAIPATDPEPVVLTTLSDDTVGGDTNLDGDDSLPKPGDWDGLSVAGSGQLNLTEFAEVRYTRLNRGGTLADSQTWSATDEHVIDVDVAVPAGVTLTIEAGAIVKLGDHVGIYVEPGGELIAEGTSAEPIYITSVHDDSLGSDASGNGDATTPAAGDWRWIHVNGGQASLDHVHILYGGGTESGDWESTGVVRTTGAATIALTNSVIRDAFFDGVLAWGGDVDVVNCVLTGCDRAVSAHPDSQVHVVNCTVDDSRVGLLVHGGTLDVANTIVTHSLEAGIRYDWGTMGTIAYTNVWAPEGSGSTNYENTADLTGTGGNISADPLYFNRANGQFQLRASSPATDAGTSDGALPTDFLGRSRYDEPHVANTGAGAQPWVDLGAFERQQTATSNTDLSALSVDGPTSGLPGESATVRWHVLNRGGETATGQWYDGIYLSVDTVWSPDDLLLGEAFHTGDLGPGQTYLATADVALPPVLPGDYFFIVRPNWRHEVLEGESLANNAGASYDPIAMDLPELSLGTPLDGELSATGDVKLYRLTTPEGGDVRIDLDGPTGSATELYVKYGDAPSRQFFDHRGIRPDWPDQTVSIADTMSGDHYYVMVYGADIPAPGAFTLTASLSGFTVDEVMPASGSNTGQVTLAIEGAQFTASSQARLVDSLGQAIDPLTVYVTDSGLLSATFDLAGAALGPADVQVINPGDATATLEDGFEVAAGEPGILVASLSVPDRVRPARSFPIVIEYANEGDTDLVAPLLRLRGSGDAQVGLDPAYSGCTTCTAWTDSLVLIAVNPIGSAGVLPPGAWGRIELMGRTTSVGAAEFTLTSAGVDGAAINWTAQEAGMRPADMPDGEWDPLFAQLQANIGTTWADFRAAISEDASLLPPLLGLNYSLEHVFQLEADKALADLGTPVSGRVFLNDTEHPLADVTVYLKDLEIEQARHAVSLNDGSFLFPELEPGDYTVTVSGAALPEATEWTVGAMGLEGQELIVEPGATISGRVVFAADGAPGADILVSAFSEEGHTAAATTAYDGTFLLDSLPAGTYQVVAGGGELAYVCVADIEVVAGQALSHVNLAIGQAGTIEGTVTGPGGPIEGAVVAAIGQDGAVNSAVTSAAGEYSIDSLPPGSYTVSATASGHVTGQASGVGVAAEATTPGADIALSLGGTVQATITSLADGSSAPGVFVALENAEHSFTTATDDDGLATMADLPPGDYDVTLWGQAWMAATTTVSVVAGEVADLSEAVAPAGIVSGTVSNSSAGGPIAKVVVFATSNGEVAAVTVTGEDGTYEMTGLATGDYEIVLGDMHSPGVARAPVSIDTANTSATVDLSAPVAGIVSGHVLESDGVTAWAGIPVTLVQGDQAIISMDSEDDDGAFAFVVLADGVYQLEVGGADAAFSVVTGINVSGGATLTDLDLVAGSEVIAGTVTRAANAQPVEGADVVLVRVDPGLVVGSMVAVETAADGTFTFDGAVPGTYEVSVLGDALAFGEQQVVVVAGTPAAADFALAAESTISGVVRDGATAALLEGASVCLHADGDSAAFAAASTDANGAYLLTGLPPGTYDLTVLLPGYETVVVQDTVLGSAAEVVDAGLVEASTRVSGAVSAPSGPLPGVIVTARNPDGFVVADTRTGQDGVYQIEQLPPGDYTVAAFAPGYQDASPVGITLGAGQALDTLDLAMAPIAISDFTWLFSFDDLERYATEPSMSDALSAPSEAFFLSPEAVDLLTATAEDPACEPLRIEALEAIRLAHISYERLLAFWEEHQATLREAASLESSALAEAAAYKARQSSEFAMSEAAALCRCQPRGPLRARIIAAEKRFCEDADGVPALYPYLKDTAGLQSYDIDGIRRSRKKLGELLVHWDSQFPEVYLGFDDWIEACDGAYGGGAAVASATAAATDLRLVEATWRKFFNHLCALHAYLFRFRAYHRAADWANSAYWKFAFCLGDDPYNPDPPDGDELDGQGLGVVTSFDPNDKLGPAGFGAQGFIRPGILPYEILFENDPDLGATVPAQEVFITDALDPDLDLTTLEFTSFGFNNMAWDVPGDASHGGTAGLSHYETVLDLRPYAIDLLVPVVLDLDADTRTLSATFRSLDPLTGLLPDDVDAGFLPVNDDQLHNGEGFVRYRVSPSSSAPSGTEIANQASIVFDVNPPIDTPQTLHTLDAGGPTSSVSALAATQPTPSFLVEWTGTDDAGGSGIASYDIHVATDGGAFELWLDGTTETSATFDGERMHSYAFYSVATDNVGYTEDEPAAADATTEVLANQAPAIGSLVPAPNPLFQGEQLTLTANGVADTDGTVALVDFYRDGDGNGTLEVGTDPFLGSDSDGGDGWLWTGAASFDWGQHTCFAQAQDDEGERSDPASATVTIRSQPPAIGSLASQPDPVEEGQAFALTADNVTDPDSTVASVAFYRDTNGNGTLETGSDPQLGTDTDGVDGWSIDLFAAFGTGQHTYFAQAQDDSGEVSPAVSCVGTVDEAQSDLPTIGALTPTPDPAIQGRTLTLTATGVYDPGGSVNDVAFYRDTNGNGTLEPGEDQYLGLDQGIADGWNLEVAVTWSPGEHTYFARAWDFTPQAGPPTAATGTVVLPNDLPTIDTLTPAPEPVSQGDTLTLTANGVDDADGLVTEVRFYRDTNDNDTLEVGADALLGTDLDGADGWSWSGAATFPVGRQMYFAVATDDEPEPGLPVATRAFVQTPGNQPPTLALIEAVPEPAVQGYTITLTATGADDLDGTVIEVEFFRDVNGNQTLEPAVDAILSTDDTPGDGWGWADAVDFGPGAQTYFARARDSEGAVSDPVSLAGTVQGGVPWSTFLGGANSDGVSGIAVDGDGNLFMTGQTASEDFPGLTGWDTTLANTDAYLSKCTSDGALLWSTYIGGSDGETGNGVTVDGSGNVYVVGSTSSDDFPTLNAWDTTYEGDPSDAYVAKFDTNGTPLWLTYLGGNAEDSPGGVATDTDGNVYVVGTTYSTDLPAQDGWDATPNGQSDVFISTFHTDGDHLWTTYLGGSGWEGGAAIATDGAGNVYVTGEVANVAGFPTPGGWQRSFGGVIDAFVAKFDTGGDLEWCSYLGGDYEDRGCGIATSGAGNVLVTGFANSDDFPTRNGWDRTNDGDQDAFVANFDADGDLLWSTFLGGDARDTGYAVACDVVGNVYVTGGTTGGTFPILDPWDDSYNGDGDAFLAKLGADGVPVSSTFLGGDGHDAGHALASPTEAVVYLAGTTTSATYPAHHGADPTYDGQQDGCVSKLMYPAGPNTPPTLDSLTVAPDPVGEGEAIALTANGVADADGTVQAVEFYRDADEDQALDPETDDLLGADGNPADGWAWSGNAVWGAGSHTYFARAQDDDADWSDPVATAGAVQGLTDGGILIGRLDVAGGQVWVYDTDAPTTAAADVTLDDVVVKGSKAGIKKITLNPQHTGLGIAIVQAPGSNAPVSVKDNAKAPHTISYIVGNCDFGSVKLTGDLIGHPLDDAELAGGAIALPDDPDADGIADDRTGLWTPGNIKKLDVAGDIDADLVFAGNAASLRGRGALTGDVAAGGYLKKLDVAGDWACRLEALWVGKARTKGTLDADIATTGADPKKGLSIATLQAARVGDATLDVPGGIKTVKAGEWLGGAITAAWLGKLTLAGDFCADIEALSVTSMTVKGNLDGATLNLTQAIDPKLKALGKLIVKGWTRDTAITAAGNVAKFQTGGMDGSCLLLGMGGTELPDEAADFTGEALLKSFTVKGIKDGKLYLDSFIDSDVAAWCITKASVREVVTDNASEPFGFAWCELKSLTWIDGGEKFKWPEKKPTDWPDDTTDFVAEEVI